MSIYILFHVIFVILKKFGCMLHYSVNLLHLMRGHTQGTKLIGVNRGILYLPKALFCSITFNNSPIGLHIAARKTVE